MRHAITSPDMVNRTVRSQTYINNFLSHAPNTLHRRYAAQEIGKAQRIEMIGIGIGGQTIERRTIEKLWGAATITQVWCAQA